MTKSFILSELFIKVFQSTMVLLPLMKSFFLYYNCLSKSYYFSAAFLLSTVFLIVHYTYKNNGSLIDINASMKNKTSMESFHCMQGSLFRVVRSFITKI